jgi:hypothetical protein
MLDLSCGFWPFKSGELLVFFSLALESTVNIKKKEKKKKCKTSYHNETKRLTYAS